MNTTGCPLGHGVEWRGCYKGQYDLWSPESYSHPAKMAPNLAFRILEHLEELGLLRQGMTVLDPMCGISTSLLTASVKGYCSVGVELEEKFVSLARANAERLKQKGFVAPIEIIQGDARDLAGLLGDVGMMSPPYSRTADSRSGIDYAKQADGRTDVHGQGGTSQMDYGTTPDQIGRLPDMPVGITSPPYGDTDKPTGGLNDKPSRPGRKDQAGRSPGTPTFQGMREGYGQSEGQIGALPDTVAITSPPYLPREDRRRPWGGSADAHDEKDAERGYPSRGRQWRGAYSDEPSNLGNPGGATAQETYLAAMFQVYQQLAQVCPVLVVVVKDPTRDKKIRELGRDTMALMEQVGYQIYDYHQAVLFEEQEQGHLFEGVVHQVKGRLSFFKRLAKQKGSPVAAYEHVIVGVKQMPLVMG